MSAQHTPGPWTQHSQDKSKIIATGVFNKDGSVIQVGSAWGPAGRWGEVKEEHFANARLIAAAPELLEAAKVILKRMFEQGKAEDQIYVDILSAAIGKATK